MGLVLADQMCYAAAAEQIRILILIDIDRYRKEQRHAAAVKGTEGGRSYQHLSALRLYQQLSAFISSYRQLSAVIRIHLRLSVIICNCQLRSAFIAIISIYCHLSAIIAFTSCDQYLSTIISIYRACFLTEYTH